MTTDTISEYEGTEYLVLIDSRLRRSNTAHIEDLSRARPTQAGWTLCGKRLEETTRRAGENICRTCDRIAT